MKNYSILTLLSVTLFLVGATTYASGAENLPSVKDVQIDAYYGCSGGKDRDEKGNLMCSESLLVSFTVNAYSCHSYLPEIRSEADGSMQLVVRDRTDENCTDAPTISEKKLKVGMSGPFENPIGAIAIANPILANQAHR